MLSVFEFEDYISCLEDFLASQPKAGKQRLARILGCQPGYLSQIFAGQANLSAEQGERLASHLGYDPASTQYLLLMISHARAGTESLRSHLKSEIKRQREQAQVLKNRFKPEKVLSVEDQSTFYSSWHYGAMHVSVSIPGCDTEEGLATYFDLPLKRVNELIAFLIRTGLVVKRDDGKLGIGSTQVFVGADSPLISKHHTNWRFKAIDSFDRYNEKHLHYSSVISVAEKDVERIRAMMVETIEKIRAIVRPSKDEQCYSYAFDLFEVGKKKI